MKAMIWVVREYHVLYVGESLDIEGLWQSASLQLRNVFSTAGNSMTSSERPSPEPLLKKEVSPAIPRRRAENALEASNALNYGGSPLGEFQERLWEHFQGLSGISSGKVPTVWPTNGLKHLLSQPKYALSQLQALSQRGSGRNCSYRLGLPREFQSDIDRLL